MEIDWLLAGGLAFVVMLTVIFVKDSMTRAVTARPEAIENEFNQNQSVKEKAPMPLPEAKQQRKLKKQNKNVVATYTTTTNEVSSRTLDEILRDLGEKPEPQTVEKGRKDKRKKSKDQPKEQQQQQQQSSVKEQQKAQKGSKQQANQTQADKQSATQKAELGNKESKKEKLPSINHYGMERGDDEKPAAPVNAKRSSSGNAGSFEDAEEEFLSADEFNELGSNSRLTTPPTEFVDARAACDGPNELMLDGANYRADDEDVDVSVVQPTANEEDEFIPVGKNNRKKALSKDEKRAGSANDDRGAARHSPLSAAQSARRNMSVSDEGPHLASSNQPRRFSAQQSVQSQQQQQQPNAEKRGGRPMASAATLADYMEGTKKETHKNAKYKHKPSGGYHKHHQHSPQQSHNSHLDEAPFVDAVETTSPICVNTTSPAPAFSYADAAKKSSGENTPHEMSPTPHATTSTTVTMPTTTSPHNSAPSAACVDSKSQELSFIYEESLDEKNNLKKRQQQQHQSQNPHQNKKHLKPEDLFVRVNGREVRIGTSLANHLAKPMDPQMQALYNSLRDGWKKFMSGKPPVVYNPDNSEKPAEKPDKSTGRK
ncbi:unnamed protein product [Caenorhabditis bovis]|uniref:Uncharacterized protein n=1 Tax=Caenorhabditis bovis TaxID=2654633 RepID=A0A8S1ETP5_9PELO|nr:unnamed protein product [Caenorhabditis bovis]